MSSAPPTTSAPRPTGAPPQERLRLVELDSLRGIAALAVVLFHWTSYYDTKYGHTAEMPLRFPWGTYGVHLFFIISGFVITMTLERSRTPASFLRARFYRLYPTFWAGVVVGTLAALWNRRDMLQPLWVVAANFTMIPGFLDVPRVDGVYWTLELELVFYVGMALLVFRKNASFDALPSRLLIWCTAALTWYAVVRFATGSDPATAQWAGAHSTLEWLTALTLTRYIGLFAIGVQLYAMAQGRKPGLVGYALFGAATINQYLWGHRGGVAACVCSTALVYFAAFYRPSWLRWKPLLLAGALSYPIYLVHQNLGFAVIRTGYQFRLHPALALVLAAISVFAVTYAMRRWVEQPAIALGRRSRSRSTEKPAA
ncbi:MAG: acyltransferase [Polyangiaceae bacterium]|nr:acyltransferase [Polyangiaceae bacterium]